MLHYCKDCALAKSSGGECPLFKMKPEEEQTACPKFQSELIVCSICGKAILDHAIIDTADDVSCYVCGQCVDALDTCIACAHCGTCAFRTDQTCPEPLTVPITVRQGNAVIQTQQMNPKRVELLCTNCPCYSPTTGCMRSENSKCDLYRRKYYD